MIERAELAKQLIEDIDYVARMFEGENADHARVLLNEICELLGGGE